MKKLLLLLLVCTISHPAFGGIVLTGTRLVFAPGAKEGSIVIKGDPQSNFLIQSWLELDKSTSFTNENGKLPLAVVPGLASLPAGRQQLLRVVYEGEGFPQDRETAVWLNVQEIPTAVNDKNVLQFATRQRIKVFYRPKELTDSAEDAVKKSIWFYHKVDSKPVLKIKNPSPFYLSLARVAIGSSNDYLNITIPMLAPFQEEIVDISNQALKDGTVFSFARIGDYGNLDFFSINLSEQGSSPVPIEKKDDQVKK